MMTRLSATIPWRKWPLLLDWIREHRIYTLATPITMLGEEIASVDVARLHSAQFHAPDSTYDVVVDVWEEIRHDAGVLRFPPELLSSLRELLRDEKAIAA